MIAQELVKPGVAFVGKGGEVRHVIIVHKPGSGYGVSWDSVPLDGNYWRGCVAGRRWRWGRFRRRRRRGLPAFMASA